MKLTGGVLYEAACEVVEGENLYRLAEGMLEIMRAEGGVGLAAPQVGESVRLVVGAAPDGSWSFVLVNPRFTFQSTQVCNSREECLSFPGREVVVQRHKIVSVEGYDLEWRPVKIRRVRGLLGICLQHEVDHLDGRCIVGPE